ncbi:unnamed protein product [Heterobilharzia americana]|nr:unnamed protein product [Heterobilharzia americana]
MYVVSFWSGCCKTEATYEVQRSEVTSKLDFYFASYSSSESNVTKFDSPFVRGLEDFITTDNRDSKDSTHLRCSKALSTENITKFGKQRTVPKTKRPSRLKRCILSERAVRSELRSQSLPATKITLDHLETVVSTSELGQAKLNTLDVRKTVANCSKPPSTMQKDLITELITQLAIFQDRAYVIYANNPFYRKRAKRFVCGFHEVVKHLKLKHMRIIIVARDLEGNATDCIRQNKIGVKGQDNEVKVVLTALEEKLCQIWRLADEYEPPVPILVSHTRRKLARLCHKPSFVSIVGIINADGAYEVERKLLDMKAGVNLGFQKIWKLYRPEIKINIAQVTQSLLSLTVYCFL